MENGKNIPRKLVVKAQFIAILQVIASDSQIIFHDNAKLSKLQKFLAHFWVTY